MEDMASQGCGSGHSADAGPLPALASVGFDETELGRIVWHCSEEDGGPDVGLQLGLGDERSLFVGEMPDSTLRECGIDLGKHPDGWWVTLYDGNSTSVVGSVCDQDAARSLFEAIAAAISKATGEKT